VGEFSMRTLGKVLVVTGGVITLAGAVLLMSGKLPLVGKLPGDIIVRGKSATFYFPVVTMIILSIVLTIVLNLLFRK